MADTVLLTVTGVQAGWAGSDATFAVLQFKIPIPWCTSITLGQSHRGAATAAAGAAAAEVVWQQQWGRAAAGAAVAAAAAAAVELEQQHTESAVFTLSPFSGSGYLAFVTITMHGVGDQWHCKCIWEYDSLPTIQLSGGRLRLTGGMNYDSLHGQCYKQTRSQMKPPSLPLIS